MSVAYFFLPNQQPINVYAHLNLQMLQKIKYCPDREVAIICYLDESSVTLATLLRLGRYFQC